MKKALILTDPEVDAARVDSVLRWVFRTTSREALDVAEPLRIETLLQRLKGANLRRIGVKL